MSFFSLGIARSYPWGKGVAVRALVSEARRQDLERCKREQLRRARMIFGANLSNTIKLGRVPCAVCVSSSPATGSKCEVTLGLARARQSTRRLSTRTDPRDSRHRCRCRATYPLEGSRSQPSPDCLPGTFAATSDLRSQSGKRTFQYAPRVTHSVSESVDRPT